MHSKVPMPTSPVVSFSALTSGQYGSPNSGHIYNGDLISDVPLFRECLLPGGSYTPQSFSTAALSSGGCLLQAEDLQPNHFLSDSALDVSHDSTSGGGCHHNCEKYMRDAIAFIDREGRVILNTSYCPADDVLHSPNSSMAGSGGSLQQKELNNVYADTDFLTKKLEQERIIYAERNRRGGHANSLNVTPCKISKTDPSLFEGLDTVLTEESQDSSFTSGGHPGSSTDIEVLQMSATLKQLMEEAKLVPSGTRLQLVEHVISATMEAHMNTCNYTAEKVAEGLRKYNEMMKDKPKVGKMDCCISALSILLTRILKCLWLSYRTVFSQVVEFQANCCFISYLVSIYKILL